MLFALRDYEIRDEKGSAVVRGRGCWLIIDIEKKRPLRVQPFIEPLPPNMGIDAFPAGCPGLETQGGLSKISERTAFYSDIDFYGHVNNARYIQWIQDAADMDALTGAGQIRLDINYLSEVKPGETIELWSAPFAEKNFAENSSPADYPGNAHCYAFEGRRPGAGQPVFRAELRV